MLVAAYGPNDRHLINTNSSQRGMERMIADLKRFFIFLAILTTLGIGAVANENSRDVLKAFAPSGSQSYILVDAANGRVLDTFNSEKKMTPASVAKAMTALYGLRTLGSNWRFETKILARENRIIDGVLQGDLILQGSGDPRLDTESLAQLVDALSSRGIRAIAGSFFYDDRALPFQESLDREQPVYVGYNPSISGLNLNFNRVFFEWVENGTSYDLSLRAKTKNFAPLANTISIETKDRDKPVYSFSLGEKETWGVASRALKKSGNRWLPVKRPAPYAADIFRTLALEKGISLPIAKRIRGVAVGTVIASVSSPKLVDLTKDMLRFSNNLMAEAIGISASLKRRSNPRSAADSAREMTTWLRGRYGLASLKQVDHSGLGKASKISTQELVKVLVREGWNNPLRRMMKKLELRDENWKKIKGQKAKITAKTGTLNFTSTLAGYLETETGRRLAFAIFTEDRAKIRAIPKDKRDAAPGGRQWARQSRVMQHQILDFWADKF